MLRQDNEASAAVTRLGDYQLVYSLSFIVDVVINELNSCSVACT
jgi:hypothetical protein